MSVHVSLKVDLQLVKKSKCNFFTSYVFSLLLSRKIKCLCDSYGQA